MSQSPTELQRLIEEAVAGKDREIAALRDSLRSQLDAMTRERDQAKREWFEDFETRTHLLAERDAALKIIEDAKSAFGEHPDTEMDLAHRISELRDENRAWFHKYTQNALNQ